MKKKFNLILVTLGFLLISPSVFGQCVSLTTISTAYTQNFDTLSNTAGSTMNNLTITGWFLTETGGGMRDNEQYAVDTGGSTTGDTYSYGSTASTERALGGLRSGTLIPIFGACFTNNTGTTITSLDIAYTGEQWRLGVAARTDQITFEYSTNATDLTTGTWTGVTALDFVTPNTVTTGAKDGNAASNRTSLSSTVPSLSIANGATFWIRWTDTDASGADDGLSVDDFSLTPQIALAAPAQVGGRVADANGNGISKVQVKISGGELNEPIYAITSPFGYYSFEVPAGQTYIVSVGAKNYTFSNPTRVINVNDNVTDLDFTADAP
jgi:hypothetical protein